MGEGGARGGGRCGAEGPPEEPEAGEYGTRDATGGDHPPLRLAVVAFVLGEPGLRHALLDPRQPGLDDEIVQLLAVEPCEVGDSHQHRRIVVEVRRREVDAAVVGEADLLLVEVADAEHQHVVETLSGVRVDGVGQFDFDYQEIAEALGWDDFGNDDFEEIMSTHYGRMVVLDDRVIMFANPEDAAEYIDFDLKPVA